MLYLGIDLHLKQMTVSLRNEDGDVVLRRQVSTRRPKLEEFREQLRQVAAADEKYVAIVEVCGFHDWLVKWLQQDERCHLVPVVQALGRSATKTDRRDANALSELLWINRERLLRGDRVHGVRTVHQPGEEQLADRRLTAMRERLVRRRTQTLNQIHKILRRHNLEWERPTKTFQTGKVAQWLKTLPLEPMDRFVLNQLLVQWKLWEEQIVKVDTRIGQRFLADPDAQLLATIPGVNAFIAVAIASRIAPIARFPHGQSLANFLGLTPGCRSSGDTERPGSITKVGSRTVRCLLAEVVLHLLRRDGTVRTWYLGHFRHGPNAFWLTPPTPFWSEAVARSGQTHLEQLRCLTKVHRSRPPERQNAICQLPQVTSTSGTCAAQPIWGVRHHHLPKKPVAVARLGVGDPIENRQVRCAHRWRTPEPVPSLVLRAQV